MNLFKGNSTEHEGDITKTVTYDIKPITVEDAKLKLQSERDKLFMPFINVETNEVNVIYKKNDGSLGIVIPE